MIKIEDRNVSFKGKAIDLVAEFAVISTRLIECLSKNIPEGEVVGLLRFTFEKSVEVAGMSEEELREKEKAFDDFINNFRKNEDK